MFYATCDWFCTDGSYVYNFVCVCISVFTLMYAHRRTGQHPSVLPEWIRWGGSSRNFPGSVFSGGVVPEIFRARFGGGVVAGFSPLTAVTDPNFVLFKHVLCFARIMSTLCPNVCRQAAPRPVRLCVCFIHISTDLHMP